jgi:hypothetical protein
MAKEILSSFDRNARRGGAQLMAQVACLPSPDHPSVPGASRGADGRFLGAAGDFRGSKCLGAGARPLE